MTEPVRVQGGVALGIKIGVGLILAPFIVGGAMCVGCGLCTGVAGVGGSLLPDESKSQATSVATVNREVPPLVGYGPSQIAWNISDLTDRIPTYGGASPDHHWPRSSGNEVFSWTTPIASSTVVTHFRRDASAWQVFLQRTTVQPGELASGDDLHLVKTRNSDSIYCIYFRISAGPLRGADAVYCNKFVWQGNATDDSSYPALLLESPSAVKFDKVSSKYFVDNY